MKGGSFLSDDREEIEEIKRAFEAVGRKIKESEGSVCPLDAKEMFVEELGCDLSEEEVEILAVAFSRIDEVFEESKEEERERDTVPMFR